MSLLTASIAYDDIEATEPANGISHQMTAERFVAQIARDTCANALFGLDERDDLSRIGLLGGKVIDGYVRSLPRVSNRRCPTHSGVTAGDQRFSSSETA
jgi:hypothetical protein